MKEKARLAGSAVDGGDPTFGGTRVGIRAAMKMAVEVSDRWKKMAWSGLAMWCRRKDGNLRIVVETLHSGFHPVFAQFATSVTPSLTKIPLTTTPCRRDEQGYSNDIATIWLGTARQSGLTAMVLRYT